MSKLVLFILSAVLLSGCTIQVEPSAGDDDMSAVRYGWSQSGDIMPGDTSGGVTMQAQFAEPGNYNCQFNIIDPNRGAQINGGYVRARAEIVWSLAGNSVRRVVDCGSGISVNGVAEAVSVNIYDDSILGLNGPPVGTVPYTVSVQCGIGTRPAVQKPPTYSLNWEDNITIPGFSPVFQIPQDIGAISVGSLLYSSNDAGPDPLPPYSVLLVQTGTSSVLAVSDPRLEFWTPLMPGTLTIAYLFTAGVVGSGAGVRPIIGIDG